MVYLIDANTEMIMEASVFEFSVDNENWVSPQILSPDLEAETELSLSGKFYNDRGVRTSRRLASTKLSRSRSSGNVVSFLPQRTSSNTRQGDISALGYWRMFTCDGQYSKYG